MPATEGISFSRSMHRRSLERITMNSQPKSDPATDREKANVGQARHGAEEPVGGKKYPGEHSDSSTVKNPKTPETSGKNDMNRVADRAAHKPARDEQETEKDQSIFTH
jgi:hypothetical protein